MGVGAKKVCSFCSEVDGSALLFIERAGSATRYGRIRRDHHHLMGRLKFIVREINGEEARQVCRAGRDRSYGAARDDVPGAVGEWSRGAGAHIGEDAKALYSPGGG
jgi:hypothetical protein